MTLRRWSAIKWPSADEVPLSDPPPMKWHLLFLMLPFKVLSDLRRSRYPFFCFWKLIILTCGFDMQGVKLCGSKHGLPQSLIDWFDWSEIWLESETMENLPKLHIFQTMKVTLFYYLPHYWFRIQEYRCESSLPPLKRRVT